MSLVPARNAHCLSVEWSVSVASPMTQVPKSSVMPIGSTFETKSGSRPWHQKLVFHQGKTSELCQNMSKRDCLKIWNPQIIQNPGLRIISHSFPHIFSLELLASLPIPHPKVPESSPQPAPESS